MLPTDRDIRAPYQGNQLRLSSFREGCENERLISLRRVELKFFGVLVVLYLIAIIAAVVVAFWAIKIVAPGNLRLAPAHIVEHGNPLFTA